MPCHYTMDPSGDVIITLRKPNTCLTVWANSPSQSTDDAQALESKPVTFLVSSRHLILASPVFKAMLTGCWAEGRKQQHSPTLFVDAEDWDAEAFAIAMNLLHGRCQQVPRTITLELLGRLALVVDYYKMHEPFQIISEIWIKHLRLQLPNDLDRDTVLFMLVSFVFDDAVSFEHVTKVAVLTGRKDLKLSEDIPIPRCIIDEINHNRRYLMDSIAAGLQKLRVEYSEGVVGCDFTCSALQLGLLIKSLHTINFWDQRPDSLACESPFGNYNLVEVLKVFAEMKNPSWYSPPQPSPYGRKPIAHSCSIAYLADMTVFELGVGEKFKPEGNAKSSRLIAKFTELLNGVKHEMGGLRLEDYVEAGDN